MKSLLKLSLKLLLSFIATSVISFISMMMALSADIDLTLKIVFGLLFIVFILFLAFSTAQNKGVDDTKNNTYKPYNGFVSGFIVMIPALIVLIIYLTLSFHGWDGENRVMADGFYMILYLLFLSYTPILSVLTPFNPAFSVDFAQPAITILKNISTPNAVFGPFYLIPIVLFIIAAGVGYILGHKERASILDALKKIKKEK